jgi:hypothetical protein
MLEEQYSIQLEYHVLQRMYHWPSVSYVVLPKGSLFICCTQCYRRLTIYYT